MPYAAKQPTLPTPNTHPSPGNRHCVDLVLTSMEESLCQGRVKRNGRTTENQNLSPEDTKELAKCVMFLILVGGIVLIVWIVKGKFAEDKWVAIGAAAALLQAIGVVGGVVYAALQLKAIREESRTKRSDVLLDQLARQLFDMEREAQTARASWKALSRMRSTGQKLGVHGKSREILIDHFGPQFLVERDGYEKSKSSFLYLLDAAEPLVQALSKHEDLEFELLRIAGKMLPSAPLELFGADSDPWKVDFLEEIETGIRQFRKQIALLLGEVAPFDKLRKN
jgi:hypothetical protein